MESTPTISGMQAATTLPKITSSSRATTGRPISSAREMSSAMPESRAPATAVAPPISTVAPSAEIWCRSSSMTRKFCSTSSSVPCRLIAAKAVWAPVSASSLNICSWLESKKLVTRATSSGLATAMALIWLEMFSCSDASRRSAPSAPSPAPSLVTSTMTSPPSSRPNVSCSICAARVESLFGSSQPSWLIRSPSWVPSPR